jgi:hypothetical protein
MHSGRRENVERVALQVEKSGENGVKSTVNVLSRNRMWSWILELRGHGRREISRGPVICAVFYLLAASLILEEGVNHIDLPGGAGRVGHDAVSKAELFTSPVRDDNSEVAIIAKEKHRSWSLKKIMTNMRESAPDISEALIRFAGTSGEFKCDFSREKDNVVMKRKPELNECVDNRGGEFFSLQQQREILARERSSRSSETRLVVEALLN